jgi:hypothetical protein
MGDAIGPKKAADLAVPLERDVFMRTLIRELSGTLEDVVGLRDASGFVSVVGQTVGDDLNAKYKEAYGVSKLNSEQIGDVLVDLKRRIHGDFYIVDQNDEKIVLRNRRCPFGDKVLGRESMCMMTSNVFGVIAAQNSGYANVELRETIARGNPECHVIIHLRRSEESGAGHGREYFATDRDR